jgi:hypothetical protein
MASITFAIDDELKSKLSKFLWINFSELAKQELLRRQQLIERFNSKEEQELIKWSVDLGRRAKKGRFKQLLKEVSPEIKEKLVLKLSPKEKREYL